MACQTKEGKMRILISGKKKIIAGLLLPALVLLSACSTQVATPTPSSEETQAIAEEAYIFAYPMLEDYKTMYIQSVSSTSPTYRAPFNQLTNATVLVGPEFKDVVRPINDTLYSIVWLDLRAEPMAISVPAIPDRYYSFQLVDLYTYNFAYIGTRATGTASGSYLVTGPAWQEDKPSGVTDVFRSEGNFVFCIVRTAVDGQADVPNVAAIQQQYRFQPLSAFLGQPTPTVAPGVNFPPYDQAKALSADFIQYFNFLLGQLVVDPSERDLITKFGRIGIGPNRPFDAASLDTQTQRAINDGVTSALAKIKAKGAQSGQQKNGWNLTPRIFGDRQQMQGQYLVRAAAAYMGLYGNDLEEAYYPSSGHDISGDPLDGSKSTYELIFTKDEIPAVDAFWSLTMYSSPDQLLVENPIQRYSISDRTAGLLLGADGSQQIYIQRESPGADKEANWLPAPNGPFSVTMRMYLPQAQELDPLYAPPSIHKRE
jgi:hypothetical protein